MTTVPQLAQTLQSVFTTTADAAARATGFVQRRSKLTGAAFVQALVFGWLANPHASLAALAQAAAVAGEPVAIPLLQRFSAVVLLDCSTIVLPDARGLWWPGCGGSSATHTQAALKLGVRFDLCNGALRGPLLYDGRTHESTTPIQSAPLLAGALRPADLGFFYLGGL